MSPNVPLHLFRMYDTYILNQKFNSTRIFILHDSTKIWKTLFPLNMSKIFIFPCNNFKKYKFGSERATILSFEPFYKQRIINKMIHIEADKNSINHRTDIANLSLIYNSIIQ